MSVDVTEGDPVAGGVTVLERVAVIAPVGVAVNSLDVEPPVVQLGPLIVRLVLEGLPLSLWVSVLTLSLGVAIAVWLALAVGTCVPV